MADCPNFGDAGSIVLLVSLFLISLPWNIVFPIALGFAYQAFGFDSEAISEFHRSMWQAMSCHSGRAYQKLYVLLLFFAVGAFVNTVLVLWLLDKRTRTAKAAKAGTGVGT